MDHGRKRLKTKMGKNEDNSFHSEAQGSRCSVCRELIANLQRFFTMIDDAGKPSSQWLTVEEVATELKVSKSVIYRIIRNGELEAVNITTSKVSCNQKGHYRVKRKCLNEYLEARKIKPPGKNPSRRRVSMPIPHVKNHLGL